MWIFLGFYGPRSGVLTGLAFALPDADFTISLRRSASTTFLVPRSAGSGASLSRSYSDTCLPACLLAFLAFLALLVLWTLYPLPPNIYPSILLPSPSPPISTNTPSGPKSCPVASRSTKFRSQFPFICRSHEHSILMSLYAPSLLRSSFFRPRDTIV